MDFLNNLNPTFLLYFIPAFVLALSVHEYAHARVAFNLGDPTAYQEGRLTLNPLKHLDPIGTLMLIFVGLGWAKPVPVNMYYFRGDRRKGMMAVAVAGPLSNIIQAFVATIIFALLLRFVPNFSSILGGWLFNFLFALIRINLVLCVFNLLPIPPLDGSQILRNVLPLQYYHRFAFLDRYGMYIFIILAITGLLGMIIFPIVGFMLGVVQNIIEFIIML